MATNSVKPFDYHIIDTFANYDTRSLLCGKKFTNYHKSILLEVIRYYANKDFRGITDTAREIIRYVQSIFDNNPNVTYDDLMKLFHSESNECMLAYILVAYNDDNIDIILKCMYTFCRVLPFDNRTEWYDNYRLNNYGNPLNMIMWHKYDCEDVYTLDEHEPLPINTSVDINFNKVVKRLVGSLRAFIIDHGLYPSGKSGVTSSPPPNSSSASSPSRTSSSSGTSASAITVQRSKKPLKRFRLSDAYSDVLTKRHQKRKTKLSTSMSGGDIEDYTYDSVYHSFRNGKKDEGSRNLTAEQICDECYLHYPYFFGGAHGCDVFRTYLTLSIDELTKFFERYPSAKVGYILNTATYESGRGEHWIALELSKRKARLICSQASDFGAFHDGGKLDEALQQHLYGQEHNITRFQTDSYSCGIFSALSLYELLMTNSIDKAVERIGNNGEKLKTGKDINDIRDKWAGTK